MDRMGRMEMQVEVSDGDDQQGIQGRVAVQQRLVAFVGALMLTQQWQVSGGAIRFYFFEVPEFAGFAIFLIIAAFFVLSFFLAVASVIPGAAERGAPHRQESVVRPGLRRLDRIRPELGSRDYRLARRSMVGGDAAVGRAGADFLHAGEDGFEACSPLEVVQKGVSQLTLFNSLTSLG